MQQNYFVTYKFHNRKGQRLSIFGTTKEGIDNSGTTCGLSIYIVKHSKTPDLITKKIDRFNKRWARTQFEIGNFAGSFTDTEINPTIINLPCTQGESKRVFMEYCNRNFYKLEVSSIFGTNIGLQFDALVKRGFEGSQPEVVILPSTVHQVKAIPNILGVELKEEDFLDSPENNLPPMSEEISRFLRENGLTN